MTNKLVVIINSLKVQKIKKILLYEMTFLVPIYSCLQNPWLGGYVPRSPFSLSSCCGLPVDLVDEKIYEEWPWVKTDPPPYPPTKRLWERWGTSLYARSCDLSHWQLMALSITIYSTFYASQNNTTKMVPCYKGAICFRFPFQHPERSLQVAVNGSDKRSDPAVGNQRAQNAGTNSLRQ